MLIWRFPRSGEERTLDCRPMEIQQIETSSSGDARFLVVVVPTGTPLRVSYFPSSSIIGDLVWNVYLALRQLGGARWKVGVFRRGVGRLKRDKLVMRDVLDRSVNVERAFANLVERTQAGEFDSAA